MNAGTSQILSKKVNELGNLPAMPSVLNSLTEHFSQDPSRMNIRKVVELISYDKSLAAHCLRMANSALFHRYSEIQSVNDAVLALGLGRVRDIVYSCSLPQLFVGAKQGMAPATFWRHALGTALISQHLGQRLAVACQDKLYLAGLLHDIGILVNALLFPREFAGILHTAETAEVPLCEVEQQELGFSHCESGRILADIWKLPASISTVIEFHHTPPSEGDDVELSAIVYLPTCFAACAVSATVTMRPANLTWVPNPPGEHSLRDTQSPHRWTWRGLLSSWMPTASRCMRW